jgi:DNA-binding transcriptional LysR family regulator
MASCEPATSGEAVDDWDALRYLLAVSREGSFTAAARRLRVDPTTVGRRVAGLEAALKTPLVVRNGPRVRLTAAGARVAALAEEAERTVQAARAVADEATRAPAGRVRVTTVQDVVDHLLLPALADVAARWPRLRIDLFTTPQVLDLAAGEADVAVRLGPPTGSHLVARHLATLVERPHAAQSWLDARGLAPGDVTDLHDREVLLILADDRWTAGFGEARPKLRAGSLATLVAAARRGLGIVLCPDALAHDLVPLPSLPIRRERALWLATTPELARVPRVRVVLDAITAAATAPLASPGPSGG